MTPAVTPLAAALRARFGAALLILSPPRCGSTALARSCWRHPEFRWYVHEPYDLVHHHRRERATAVDALDHALDDGTSATGVVLKEMTFQPGPWLPDLVAAAILPIVFTVRDPRLAIRSRMRQRELAGQTAYFPHRETGWTDLAEALRLVRAAGTPHVIVDFTRFSQSPDEALVELCARLGLAYHAGMRQWPARSGLRLGRLGGEQSHWYGKVLASTGFQRDDERPPALAGFPAVDGLREHVAYCLELYREVLSRAEVLSPMPQRTP